MNLEEIINELKLRAKSGVDILREVEKTDFTLFCRFVNAIDECLNCKCSGCKWKEEKKWVRLEDVLEILKELKEQYDLVSKDFFDLFTSL